MHTLYIYMYIYIYVYIYVYIYIYSLHHSITLHIYIDALFKIHSWWKASCTSWQILGTMRHCQKTGLMMLWFRKICLSTNWWCFLISSSFYPQYLHMNLYEGFLNWWYFLKIGDFQIKKLESHDSDKSWDWGTEPWSTPVFAQHHSGLVVTGTCMLGIFNHPNWRSPIFFRGVGFNHQPVWIGWSTVDIDLSCHIYHKP